MTGWHREEWFDETGLPWVDPSPNIRNLDEALLYPGIAMLEYSANYSVGRGTEAPFEQIGADWIRGTATDLARLPERTEYSVRARFIAAAQFTAAESSNFSGKTIVSGVRFVGDRSRLTIFRIAAGAGSGWPR